MLEKCVLTMKNIVENYEKEEEYFKGRGVEMIPLSPDLVEILGADTKIRIYFDEKYNEYDFKVFARFGDKALLTCDIMNCYAGKTGKNLTYRLIADLHYYKRSVFEVYLKDEKILTAYLVDVNADHPFRGN